MSTDSIYYSEYFRLDNETYSTNLYDRWLSSSWWNNDEFPSSIFIYLLQYDAIRYNDNNLDLRIQENVSPYTSTEKTLLHNIRFEKGKHIVYRGKAFDDIIPPEGSLLYGNTEWARDTIQF
jgi:hypothetical protein